MILLVGERTTHGYANQAASDILIWDMDPGYYCLAQSRPLVLLRSSYPSRFQNDELTTYHMALPHDPIDLSLLSVNHHVRNITMAIFFSENIITLVSVQGIIPFLQDRGQFACESLKQLRIRAALERFTPEEIDGIWTKNFKYISQHLKGLRSLALKFYDTDQRLKHTMQKIEMDPGLSFTPPGMTWLSDLAAIRNLSSFQIEFECDHTSSYEILYFAIDAIAALQQYLWSKVS